MGSRALLSEGGLSTSPRTLEPKKQACHELSRFQMLPHFFHVGFVGVFLLFLFKGI